MEVILSAAFGIESESQTNPEDKITTYARNAMDSQTICKYRPNDPFHWEENLQINCFDFMGLQL